MCNTYTRYSKKKIMICGTREHEWPKLIDLFSSVPPKCHVQVTQAHYGNDGSKVQVRWPVLIHKTEPKIKYNFFSKLTLPTNVSSFDLSRLTFVDNEVEKRGATETRETVCSRKNKTKNPTQQSRKTEGDGYPNTCDNTAVFVMK